MELDPKASRAEHEAAIAKYLVDVDPVLGAILAPYLAFDRLEDLSESDRRRLRGQVAAAVREALDAEATLR
ncbi:MAG: hypothetical protein Q8R60_15040 [Mycobacteriales bacterium]|nr:hypothetical protein [Mycobacteriales bacterium]